jgi:hypothetical protein
MCFLGVLSRGTPFSLGTTTCCPRAPAGNLLSPRGPHGVIPVPAGTGLSPSPSPLPRAQRYCAHLLPNTQENARPREAGPGAVKHRQCGSSHLIWNLQAIISSYVVIVSRPAAIILKTQGKSASMEFNSAAGNFESIQAHASNGALPLSLSA